MRTTVTLDDDVVAIIERERREKGETTRQAINRLIRTATHRSGPRPELPIVPGRLELDISDVSEVLAGLDETDDDA
ncbi:MAG: CopG family transcriptional regulator [Acidimicrobiia bacterium]